MTRRIIPLATLTVLLLVAQRVLAGEKVPLKGRAFVYVGASGFVYKNFMGMVDDVAGVALGATADLGLFGRRGRLAGLLHAALIPLSTEQERVSAFEYTRLINELDVDDPTYTGVDTVLVSKYYDEEYSHPVFDLGVGMSTSIRRVSIYGYAYGTLCVSDGFSTDTLTYYLKDGSSFTPYDEDVSGSQHDYLLEISGIALGASLRFKRSEIGVEIAWYRDLQRLGVFYRYGLILPRRLIAGR